MIYYLHYFSQAIDAAWQLRLLAAITVLCMHEKTTVILRHSVSHFAQVLNVANYITENNSDHRPVGFGQIQLFSVTNRNQWKNSILNLLRSLRYKLPSSSD